MKIRVTQPAFSGCDTNPKKSNKKKKTFVHSVAAAAAAAGGGGGGGGVCCWNEYRYMARDEVELQVVVVVVFWKRKFGGRVWFRGARCGWMGAAVLRFVEPPVLCSGVLWSGCFS